jgi:hypothetical protein
VEIESHATYKDEGSQGRVTDILISKLVAIVGCEILHVRYAAIVCEAFWLEKDGKAMVGV